VLRRLALIVLALAALALWVRRFWRPAPAGGGGAHAAPQGAAMVRDRVCNTFLPRSRAIAERVGSETLFFCSEGCRREFLARH